MLLSLSSAIAFALTLPLARAVDTLLQLKDAKATVYYDLANSLCGDTSQGDPFQEDWAQTSGINDGVPFCEGQVDVSLADLGTNQIVAMNATMVRADPATWCGKQVSITDSNGKELDFSGGPLFIWDACAAAMTAPIVDLSAKAFTQLKGGSCGGNNPTGITIQVLDTNIWDRAPNGGRTGGSNDVVTNSSSAQVSPFIPGVISTTSTPSSTPLVAQSTPSPTPSASSSRAVCSKKRLSTKAAPQPSTSSASNNSGSCDVYGSWQCEGLELQICNYITTTSLGWETVETCGSVCSVESDGIGDCP